MFIESSCLYCYSITVLPTSDISSEELAVLVTFGWYWLMLVKRYYAQVRQIMQIITSI
jgi:hypothetical protein